MIKRGGEFSEKKMLLPEIPELADGHETKDNCDRMRKKTRHNWVEPASV